MDRRRIVALVIAVLSLSAFSSAARKEGIRARVTAKTKTPVMFDIIGSFVVPHPIGMGAGHYYASRPYHATTPFEFWPYVADGPVLIRARGKDTIWVSVDNLLTGEHLQLGGKSVKLSTFGKQVQLDLQPPPR